MFYFKNLLFYKIKYNVRYVIKADNVLTIYKADRLKNTDKTHEF